ncbi:hypothetical protein NHX12_032034 [Muraenolepis orangiensis]|uniref:MyTH4 domain-containing protein n=1 Tax=Muraenolepis orangiensis TaxID=630683 RepID=A0A9Q0IL66_9TELE|nr:hypothetical protein NHX12_032034 [Muraenolepis orangiensis]
MVKFSKSPLQESLIDFSDRGLNRVAVDIFIAIMRFMGDHPARAQTEQDLVATILKLMKQITTNTSIKPDSCQRGWRLLYILTAFHRCSDVLRPYLLRFLLDASAGPGVQYQGIANACEQNLRRTFQYGGRVEFPNTMELKAMMAGRSSKRQLFLLPGGIERHLKIKTCSVALDAIEELCFEMGLHRPEAMEEYAIFVVTHKGQNVRPLNKREYILDIATEAEPVDANYSLWFRRVIWGMALKLDNELYVTMHYNQVLPDFLKTLMSVVPQGTGSDQQLQQISRLAALQHRGSQQWLTMITQHMQQVQPLNPNQARAQFLGLVSAFPMFGSAFFYIQSSSSASFQTPCILAVNQNGLHFLNKDTHGLELCRVIAMHMENMLSAAGRLLSTLRLINPTLVALPGRETPDRESSPAFHSAGGVWAGMMKFRFRRQGHDPQREKIKQELFAFNKASGEEILRRLCSSDVPQMFLRRLCSSDVPQTFLRRLCSSDVPR